MMKEIGVFTLTFSHTAHARKTCEGLSFFLLFLSVNPDLILLDGKSRGDACLAHAQRRLARPQTNHIRITKKLFNASPISLVMRVI